MKNSADTIKLFNEVMDYFDSLTNEEFNERFKKSENGELTNLFLSVGYFNKEEFETPKTTTHSHWVQTNFGEIYVPNKDVLSHTHKISIDMDYLYSLISFREINFNLVKPNQSDYSGSASWPMAA